MMVQIYSNLNFQCFVSLIYYHVKKDQVENSEKEEAGALLDKVILWNGIDLIGAKGLCYVASCRCR